MKKNEYDVVIIGAGIGGLVCGCYLAKSGLRTLIVEQHYRAGGYCSSFERGGFRFDVGVHYLGGIKKGILSTILDDLKLRDNIKFSKFDPTDKIIVPGKATYIRNNSFSTREEFKKNFTNEKKNIDNFFNFIEKKSFFEIFVKLHKLTFKQQLDIFFTDYKLKITLGTLLRNLGLSSAEASALAFSILLREYILDAGYYPIGGMQKLPDVLCENFKMNKGKIIFAKKITKIIIENNCAKGVVIGDNEAIVRSRFVVSNADASETFSVLLEKKTHESRIIKKLKDSPSTFAVYLGLSKNLKKITNEFSNFWPFYSYNLRKIPIFSIKNMKAKDINLAMISFPSAHDPDIKNFKNKGTMGVFMLAPFVTKKFWDEKKNQVAEMMIDTASKFFPEIKTCIVHKEIATPFTFNRFTLNRGGASFGLASTTTQIKSSVLPAKTSIKNLFLTGHWCTLGSGQGGIPRVSFSGRRVSSLILNEIGIPWKYDDYIV